MSIASLLMCWLDLETTSQISVLILEALTANGERSTLTTLRIFGQRLRRHLRVGLVICIRGFQERRVVSRVSQIARWVLVRQTHRVQVLVRAETNGRGGEREEAMSVSRGDRGRLLRGSILGRGMRVGRPRRRHLSTFIRALVSLRPTTRQRLMRPYQDQPPR